MSTAETQLAAKTKTVASLQIITSIILAVLFLMQGVWESVSALYGGFASVLTALLLSRGIQRAGEAAIHDAKQSMKILYVGAVQRFLLVIGLLALGLALLKLDPIAMCVGFGIAQISFVMSSRTRAKNPSRGD